MHSRIKIFLKTFKSLWKILLYFIEGEKCVIVRDVWGKEEL